MRYIQFYPDEKITDLQNLEEYYQLLSQSFKLRKSATAMSVTELQKVLKLQSNSRVPSIGRLSCFSGNLAVVALLVPFDGAGSLVNSIGHTVNFK